MNVPAENESRWSPEQDEVIAGQAVYSRRMLRIYDVLVLGISNRLIWKCPTPALLNWYNRHITRNHLDAGVGTGFFLDRCTFPESPAPPRIVLMDLNANCLEAAAQRIVRYQPERWVRNLLQPIEHEGSGFDSLGLNYVLHCLPGAMRDKAIVFDHLLPLLNPGGVLFGSTLLNDGVKRSFAARKLMRFYNGKGIFHNIEDNLNDLQSELSSRFSHIEVAVKGCAALFAAVK